MGQAYSYLMAASGGTAPYTFSTTAGALPTGLNLSPAGVISGSPSLAGTSVFSIQTCDSLGLCSSPPLQVSITITASGNLPALPTTWVNNLEWVGTTSNTITFPPTGTGGTWTCTGVGSFGPYTADSQTSLNQAIADAETCRTNGTGHPGTQINIPAGHLYSGTQGLTLPQTAGDTSTNFIVLQSTTPLTTGQTVCSHGIQDNVVASTQPGIRNLGCNGSAMSYALGSSTAPGHQTFNTISPGAFTLANGTNTNTSAYNDLPSLYTIELSGGVPQSAIASGPPDVNNMGPCRFAIVGAELRPQAGQGSVLAPIAIGTGLETLASQIPCHIHIAYSYIHGDWTDAAMTGCPNSCVAVGSTNGANSMPNAVSLLSCIYCSLSYSYIDKNIRPGGEGHGWAGILMQAFKVTHNWIEGGSMGSLIGGHAGPVSINGFVEGADIEDRANRYTWPYSWMLSEDAGFHPNSLLTVTGGHGIGAALNITSAQIGAINTVAIVAPGNGYAVNDLITGTSGLGANNATLVVTGVSSGALTSVAVASGTGYTVASGLATTGGHGTGATVNITSVDPAGRITGLTLGSGGTGYAANDNILNITQVGGSGGVAGIGTVKTGVIQTIFGQSGSGYYPTNGLVRKNSHEVKACQRNVTDGNIGENITDSGAQGGQLMEFTVTNSAAGKLSDNYWLACNNVTITNNVLRNGGVGPIAGSRPIANANGGSGVAEGPNFFLYSNNLFYNISLSNPNMTGQTTEYGFRLGGEANGQLWAVASGTEDATGTIATLNLTGVPGGLQTDTNVGDPVQIRLCTGDGSLNTNTTLLGPPALTGTLHNGLTIVYAHTGTPNATLNVTGCVYDNIQGYVKNFTFLHNTDVNDGGSDPHSGQNCGTNPGVESQNVTWKNSMFLNGSGYSSCWQEGNRSEAQFTDPNSLIFNNNLLTGRDTKVVCPGHLSGAAGGMSACYKEYTDAHVAVVPTTIYGSPTPYCVGNDPTTENCAGIFGAMSTGSFPLSLPDWHNYRLCKSTDAACNNKASIYAAGGLNDATDGTDLGINPAAIDAAQVSNQYCASCGSFPDH